MKKKVDTCIGVLCLIGYLALLYVLFMTDPVGAILRWP